MPEKHDTRAALSPVDSAGRRCDAHEGCMDRLYDSIASRVSTDRFYWTVGVLSGVAVAFGLALWCWTAQQCSAAQEAAAVVERRVIGMERDIEHIKVSQAEMKVEVRDGFTKLERKLERLLDAKPGGH